MTSNASVLNAKTDRPDASKYAEVVTNGDVSGAGSCDCEMVSGERTDAMMHSSSREDNGTCKEEVVDGESELVPLEKDAEGTIEEEAGEICRKRNSDTLRWGWGRWNPECFQRFNSAPWLLATLCAVVFFQGMTTSGLMGSCATSIERRFQLRSQDYGVLVSIYEATHIIFILFVTFIGGRGHKPKWVSIGCLIFGIGCLIFSLPHFTSGHYENFHGETKHLEVCEKDNDVVDEKCPDGETGDDLSHYIYVFGGAQILLALGAIPVYSLGVVIIDESVTVWNLSGTDLAAGDPGWVGAWWVGYVMTGCCMIIIAMPVGAFPRELPTTAKIRSEKECQAHINAGAEITAHPSFGSHPRDLIKAIRYLLINPTFMFTTFAGCSDALMITAFGVFLPKFIENQFSTTATVATTIVGTCIVPGGVFGVFFGGWLIRRFRLRVIGTLKLCLLMTVIMVIGSPIMLIRCPQTSLAGVMVSYGDDSDFKPNNSSNVESNLSHTCNADCLCSTNQYVPVCLEEYDLEFFSPCHAGCDNEYGNGTYGDCRCVEYASEGVLSTVAAGKCSSNCMTLPIFIPLLILLMVVLFMPMVPATNVTLRCVPESQRPMALGFQSMIGRLLGSIPGPILFGVIIDSTCLQWQETCNSQGSCWLYHNDSFARRLVVLSIVLKVACGLFYGLAWWSYKPGTRTPNLNGIEYKMAT